MFKKYLIIASKKDRAGINITTNLSQFRQSPIWNSSSEKPFFDFYLVEEEIIYTENLDIEKINKYDFVIFASRHQSEKKEKTLSVHAPGNFRTADFGGVPGKACLSSALFQKFIFEKLNKLAEESSLKEYKVTLECTHHGPLIEKPCLFIEIGSSELEWNDRRAGFTVARVIKETIDEFKENPYREIAFGIGGPHYCPSFNAIQLKTNFAISHVIPNYVSPITEEMILEIKKKTLEDLDLVILDWKGIGVSEDRQRVVEILERNRISWKKTSDIKK